MRQLPSIKKLIPILTSAANDIIIPQSGQVCCTKKPDGSPVTEVDVAVQKHIQTRLLERWPGIGFLSEEMAKNDQEDSLTSDNLFWCLDPLDGTTNYVAGIPLYAISLALISADGPLLGLVYDPVRQEMYTAEQGKGAYLNGIALACIVEERVLGDCVVAVDFKRLNSGLRCRLAESSQYKSQRNIGSVALEWCWLAAGRFQLYLHGGQNLWDYAAGELIFREAGGSACTLEGEPIFYSSLKPRSAIAAQNPCLFEQWRKYIQGLMDEN